LLKDAQSYKLHRKGNVPNPKIVLKIHEIQGTKHDSEKLDSGKRNSGKRNSGKKIWFGEMKFGET
jgi:hypothetical protein